MFGNEMKVWVVMRWEVPVAVFTTKEAADAYAKIRMLIVQETVLNPEN